MEKKDEIKTFYLLNVVTETRTLVLVFDAPQPRDAWADAFRQAFVSGRRGSLLAASAAVISNRSHQQLNNGNVVLLSSSSGSTLIPPSCSFVPSQRDSATSSNNFSSTMSLQQQQLIHSSISSNSNSRNLLPNNLNVSQNDMTIFNSQFPLNNIGSTLGHSEPLLNENTPHHQDQIPESVLLSDRSIQLYRSRNSGSSSNESASLLSSSTKFQHSDLQTSFNSSSQIPRNIVSQATPLLAQQQHSIPCQAPVRASASVPYPSKQILGQHSTIINNNNNNNGSNNSNTNNYQYNPNTTLLNTHRQSLSSTTPSTTTTTSALDLVHSLINPTIHNNHPQQSVHRRNSPTNLTKSPASLQNEQKEQQTREIDYSDPKEENSDSCEDEDDPIAALEAHLEASINSSQKSHGQYHDYDKGKNSVSSSSSVMSNPLAILDNIIGLTKGQGHDDDEHSNHEHIFEASKDKIDCNDAVIHENLSPCRSSASNTSSSAVYPSENTKNTSSTFIDAIIPEVKTNDYSPPKSSNEKDEADSLSNSIKSNSVTFPIEKEEATLSLSSKEDDSEEIIAPPVGVFQDFLDNTSDSHSILSADNRESLTSSSGSYFDDSSSSHPLAHHNDNFEIKSPSGLMKANHKSETNETACKIDNVGEELEVHSPSLQSRPRGITNKHSSFIAALGNENEGVSPLSGARESTQKITALRAKSDFSEAMGITNIDKRKGTSLVYPPVQETTEKDATNWDDWDS